MFDGVKNITIPQWVDNEVSIVSGLDLLGLRNIAQAISNYCLNGITTISPQVRYLGIRAWFILMYEKCSLPDSYSSFIDFASKLEASVAIGTILHEPDIKGVVGVTEASNIVRNSDNQITVKKLVQQLVTHMYAQPSVDLGICFPRDTGITGITEERGLPLVEIIMSEVNGTSFVRKVLKETKVDTFEVDNLEEIGKILSIEDIPEKERGLLIDAVVPAGPRPYGWQKDIMRVATYTLLLQLAKDNRAVPTPNDVFRAVLQPDSHYHAWLSDLLNGWLCFLIRDAMAVCHERVLETVVKELSSQERKRIDRDQVVQNILERTGSINEKLHTIGVLKEKESFIDLRFLDVYSRIERTIGKSNHVDSGLQRWESNQLDETILIDLSSTREPGAVGLLPVAWILAYLRAREGMDTEYDVVKMLSRGGWGRIGLKEVVSPAIEEWKTRNPKYSQVLSDMINRMVDQHVRISWSRMATDVNRDVSVMVVDGNKWCYLKEFYAGRTAARLKEAIGWLVQLKLLDDQGTTPDGDDILSRGYYSLEQYYEGTK